MRSRGNIGIILSHIIHAHQSLMQLLVYTPLLQTIISPKKELNTKIRTITKPKESDALTLFVLSSLLRWLMSSAAVAYIRVVASAIRLMGMNCSDCYETVWCQYCLETLSQYEMRKADREIQIEETGQWKVEKREEEGSVLQTLSQSSRIGTRRITTVEEANCSRSHCLKFWSAMQHT